jgi:hypothetical protein
VEKLYCYNLPDSIKNLVIYQTIFIEVAVFYAILCGDSQKKHPENAGIRKKTLMHANPVPGP